MSSELARIAHLAALFGGAGTPAGVRIGIGDDAAVLAPASLPLVWTVDAQVEGTHWRRDWLGWEDVGWRSFMAAASDLAAMSATPIAALSALALAADVDDAALDALARGQADAARAVGAAIVGGNLVRARETSVTTTLLGVAARPVLRSGARAGDGLFLGGAVGLAAAGLAALSRSDAADLGREASIAACVEAWRRPRARIDLGLAMAATATAAIDVSDGLVRDAGHVAEASGVALVFDEAALRRHAIGHLDEAARLLGLDALALALEGGEDYAILVASSSPIPGFSDVGRVEVGAPSLHLRRSDGTTGELSPAGFDHFA